jgi:hypothetical protein
MSRHITSFFCSGLIATVAMVATFPLHALASTPPECRFGGNPQGSFRRNTQILKVDWNNDGRINECFGIAPDKSIWHIWNGSRGWQKMPNGGRADNTYGWYSPNRNTRYISVCVYNSGVWRSKNVRGTWGPWSLIGPGPYCR